VSGRKTDVLDCQWLQQLHTYGLLSSAFALRKKFAPYGLFASEKHAYPTQSIHVQHMQKALDQMNLQVQQVLSDITGETGMNIIRQSSQVPEIQNY